VIDGIDHVVIAVRDLDAGIQTYETLLGRGARSRAEHDGVATALIATTNVAVELMAPVGESAGGARLRAAIDDGGEGLKSVVFATGDVERAHRHCARVGLAPEEIATRETWRSFRLSTERTHGVRIFVLQRYAPFEAALAPSGALALDHMVVRSADMERAAALYGARLGLDMRLDREVGGRRLMFFRVGDTVVEIAEDNAAADRRDRLWGLSWRVADADAERARLAQARREVSEVRPGMKPGTRVFTVRDGACGVPTLMIEAGSARD
jgi:catechol 2,3-dioxygenase-like lactoylglutathione lyase family enzyme